MLTVLLGMGYAVHLFTTQDIYQSVNRQLEVTSNEYQPIKMQWSYNIQHGPLKTDA